VALRRYVARERENNLLPEWRKTHLGDGARFNSMEPMIRAPPGRHPDARYLGDVAAVPMLSDTLLREQQSGKRATCFWAEAAAEALGRIGTPEAETAIIDAFAGLTIYIKFTYWYGDHPALMPAMPRRCTTSLSSPRCAGSTRAGRIVPQIIHAVPTDPDRALFSLERRLRDDLAAGYPPQRLGPRRDRTCLAVLGDPQAVRSKEIEESFKTYSAWAGTADPENSPRPRYLSLVCRDRT